MRRSLARSLALAVLLVAPPFAGAAETTDVATAFDADNPFDFRLRVGYEYFSKTAAIKREHEGDGQTKVELLKDLVYAQTRHTMPLRAEFGIFQDLMVSFEMPLVLSDTRTWDYDQRLGSQCVYPGQVGTVNCVNASNSLTTNPDVPANVTGDPSNYTIIPSGGVDVQNPGMPYAGVARGPKRGGSGADMLDTINFGLTWGILSQARDSTKPTWILSAEYRLSIGTVMTLDRSRPDANHGVADGLDHLFVRTAVSHRFKWVDPYAEFWFDMPFVRRTDTLFFDYGPNGKNQLPQMAGGTSFGLEFVPYEKPKEQWKIAIDVGARVSAKFDGRGYSEMWELFATSPALSCDPTWNPSCGLPNNPYTKNAAQGYTGLTTIENYATIGGQLALNVQMSKWVRFRSYFRYQHDQSHFITADDVGKPTAAGDRISKPEEYNPAYRPIINELGRRYKVDDVNSYLFGLWLQAMF